MEHTVKNHQLVADSVCKKAGGFGELEPWVRQTLSLFPAPSADLAGPLVEALLRVARAVPWLEEALGDAVVERLAAAVDTTRSNASRQKLKVYMLVLSAGGSLTARWDIQVIS